MSDSYSTVLSNCLKYKVNCKSAVKINCCTKLFHFMFYQTSENKINSILILILSLPQHLAIFLILLAHFFIFSMIFQLLTHNLSYFLSFIIVSKPLRPNSHSKAYFPNFKSTIRTLLNISKLFHILAHILRPSELSADFLKSSLFSTF